MAAARSVLLAGKDPEDENKRAIAQIKSNLAPPGAAIGFTLRGGEFFWTGESDLTAERILSYAPSESDRPALNDAAEFLRDELAGGECDVATLKSDARRAGVSEITLRRAKDRLGVKAVKRGAFKDARWFWTLPEDAQTLPEDAQKTDDEHLRASGANKVSYSNSLAEGAHRNNSEHLRDTKEGYTPVFSDPERQADWDSGKT